MPEPQRWFRRREAPPDYVQRFPQEEALLARILYARGHDTVEQARAFLQAEGGLGDPFALAGMPAAVARLRQALRAEERIVVYGDYDADGVCATVLLVSALRALGGDVRHYIPDRFDEAYGLNTPALEKLRCEGAQLVVTVDCGVRSFDDVRRAREAGLEIIITDHHSVPEALPPAVAVIDPKRPDCAYPFKELAGVGVAYRLAEALWRVAASMHEPCAQALDLDGLLDLVAVGTVADIVPLVSENRTLVRLGLARLREAPRPGLAALMEAAAIKRDEVDSTAIAFRLGPRINAAGRLDNASLAYNLLSSDDAAEAQPLAKKLGEINVERQRLLDNQVKAAQAMIGDLDGQRLLLVAGPAFHEGLVGLVASRLCEEHYRPCLVMRTKGDLARGSARSIEGFHITRALDACADLLLSHGGHARAAGFTLAARHVDALREHLQQLAEEQISEEMLSPRETADAIVGLEELTIERVAALAQLEPVGEGNTEPRLAGMCLEVRKVTIVGREGAHLRLELAADDSRVLPAIAFGRGREASALAVGRRIDLIYRPVLDVWRGETRLQLVVTDWRPSADAPSS